jgi:hypothetical protein
MTVALEYGKNFLYLDLGDPAGWSTVLEDRCPGQGPASFGHSRSCQPVDWSVVHQ